MRQRVGDKVSEYTEHQLRAYKALQTAGNRIGNNNYLAQKAEWLKKHKSMKNFRFAVTEEHKEVVNAMPKVLSGEITPEQAMGLLWDYDVMKQRLG